MPDGTNTTSTPTPSPPPSAGSFGSARNRELILNTVSSYLDRAVDAVVFLVLVPYVLGLVGGTQYGLWTLVWAVVSLLGLIDLGFSTSVVKFVADARGRADPDRLRRVVCTLFWIFVGQSGLLLLLVAILTFLFTSVFEVPAGTGPMGEFVFLVVGAGFAMKIPFGMFRGVLVGYQKLWVANAYKIGATLVYFVAVLMVLKRWPDLRVFAVLNLLISVVPAILVTIHLWRTIPGLSLRFRYFERGMLKELWTFSFFFMLINVAVLIATRVDTLVIKSTLPLIAITVYSLAMRIAEQASGFCVQIARTLTPVVAELHGAGAEEQLKRVWLQGTKLSVALAAPLLVGCAVLARPLIVTWAGAEYAEAAPVLQLLLAANLITVAHSNSYNLLSMGGQERFLALSMLAGQVLNLILSLILVQLWGIVGVALATLIAALPVEYGLIQRRMRRRYGLTTWGFYRLTVFPSLLPAALMALGCWAWTELRSVDSLWEVALVELAAVALFWLLFWPLGLRPEERTYVRERLRRRRRA